MIPAKQLLNEIAASLRGVIAPALAEPYPKTQAYMAAVILEFVARQVDERVDIADGKQAAIAALRGDLARLDGKRLAAADAELSEAGLCQLIERLYAERERLGEATFNSANRLVRETLRKLLDQELTVAGRAQD
ncbi:MAG: hypothetical protein ACREQD_03555 [Candidatus Binataceae bacterium]